MERVCGSARDLADFVTYIRSIRIKKSYPNSCFDGLRVMIPHFHFHKCHVDIRILQKFFFLLFFYILIKFLVP